jgi:hypothetical protein
MLQLDRADSESRPFLRARLGLHCRMHQASDQGMQVETSIDPVLHLGELPKAVYQSYLRFRLRKLAQPTEIV